MSDERIHELRQYTLHPGRRDDLVEVFDRWFIEGQEDVGMVVQGQFLDLDRSDRFVWLRSFPDLERRRAALEAFYGGPVWAAHRDVANATMTSWDDVLLLRSVSSVGVTGDDDVAAVAAVTSAASDAGRLADGRSLPPIGSTERPSTLISIDIHHFAEPVDQKLLDFFVDELEPVLTEAGGERLSLLTTHPGPNTFPALPIREAQVIVRIAHFDDESAHRAYREHLAQSEHWGRVAAELAAHQSAPPQRLRLQPTARSRLR